MKICARLHDKAMRASFVSFGVSLRMPVFGLMQLPMGTFGEHLKVINSIIQRIVVLMVHFFFWEKLPTQMLFHNCPSSCLPMKFAASIFWQWAHRIIRIAMYLPALIVLMAKTSALHARIASFNGAYWPVFRCDKGKIGRSMLCHSVVMHVAHTLGIFFFTTTCDGAHASQARDRWSYGKWIAVFLPFLPMRTAKTTGSVFTLATINTATFGHWNFSTMKTCILSNYCSKL